MSYNTPRFLRLFRLRTLTKTESGCWEWPLNQRNEGGYGELRYKVGGVVKKVKAHRLSYILFKGEIPEGLEIMHQCDNACCVNPDHLKPGTHMENEQDKVAKGRSLRGEDKSADLSDELAQSILDRYRDGESIRLLALEHDIPYKTCEAICHRRRWKYLT